jgi:hypothetical protein
LLGGSTGARPSIHPTITISGKISSAKSCIKSERVSQTY